VVGRDLRTQRGEVERGGHPQRPGQGPTPFRVGEAREVAMQVSPTSREPAPGIGLGGALLGHHAQQLRDGGPLSAADAGALGLGGAGHPQVAGSTSAAVAGTELSAGATSGRMSMRQPVSRAARRAFCPSRPMASESW
jgi:hypothetical protein